MIPLRGTQCKNKIFFFQLTANGFGGLIGLSVTRPADTDKGPGAELALSPYMEGRSAMEWPRKWKTAQLEENAQV
jgi:hypothetical protein